MKIVSFKVAKAIRKVGYPQDKTNKVYLLSPMDSDLAYREFGLPPFNGDYKVGDIVASESYSKYEIVTCDAPTYIDVWLWLWREKKTYIDIVSDAIGVEVSIWGDNIKRIHDAMAYYLDPEEAIVAAIDYLVDNDLIQ